MSCEKVITYVITLLVENSKIMGSLFYASDSLLVKPLVCKLVNCGWISYCAVYVRIPSPFLTVAKKKY